jgi:glycosyltransferase involved in cell wall biosynthesis
MARHGLYRPFLLYVGNIEPRKNLSRLLEAFRRSNPQEIDLVLAGRRAWLWGKILREANCPRYRERVHLLDYVPEDDLPALYQSALAFVYPSLYEGFGLPVLEAMASGTPVLASKVEPLVSLVGDAGRLVQPENEDEWRAALTEVMADGETRKTLAERGKQRATQYSWERAARETMKCYEAALSRPGPVTAGCIEFGVS